MVSLQSQLRETTLRLRTARRAQRRQSEISVAQWSVAKVLMVLRAGEPTAALKYIQRKRRGEPTAALDREAAEMLRGWWRKASEATKREILNLANADAEKKRAVAQGRRFLVECDLEAWVERQNVTKGISPMSSLVLDKAKHALRRAGLSGARTRKGGFQWLRRWRRRWGLRLRKLAPLEKPTDEEVLQKARVRRQLDASRF